MALATRRFGPKRGSGTANRIFSALAMMEKHPTIRIFR